jgi:hypothetical protein
MLFRHSTTNFVLVTAIAAFSILATTAAGTKGLRKTSKRILQPTVGKNGNEKSAKKAPPKTCNNILQPRFDKNGNEKVYAGKTYQEWANYYQIWNYGFRAAVNPSLDPTGQFAYQNQPKGIFLIGGAVQPGVVRHITIPENTLLFAPFYSELVGYDVGNPAGNPSDPIVISELTKKLSVVGVSIPPNATLAQLFSLAAKTFCENVVFSSFSYNLDGCNLDPYQEGLIWTKPEDTFVLQANPDFHIPADNYDAVQCGYNGIYTPFAKGNHTFTFTGTVKSSNNTNLWNNAGPTFYPFTASFGGVVYITVV